MCVIKRFLFLFEKYFYTGKFDSKLYTQAELHSFFHYLLLQAIWVHYFHLPISWTSFSHSLIDHPNAFFVILFFDRFLGRSLGLLVNCVHFSIVANPIGPFYLHTCPTHLILLLSKTIIFVLPYFYINLNNFFYS